MTTNAACAQRALDLQVLSCLALRISVFCILDLYAPLSMEKQMPGILFQSTIAFFLVLLLLGRKLRQNQPRQLLLVESATNMQMFFRVL